MTPYAAWRELRQYRKVAADAGCSTPDELAARLRQQAVEWADGRPGEKPLFAPSGPRVRPTRKGVAIRLGRQTGSAAMGPIGRKG